MTTEGSYRIAVPETEYALFDTRRRDLPAVVAVNKSLVKFEPKDVFPWYLSIVIEGRDLAQNRMPTRDENEVLTSLGDRLERRVLSTATAEGSTNVLWLAHLTWNGRRQLLYYVHNPEPVDHALRRMLDGGPSEREWEYVMECDPAWQSASPFLRLCSAA